MLDLESDPKDPDLLNAVFRAFHTIKGGAGFLDIKPLVETCHRAEDIFNNIRNHESEFNSDVMDAMSKVLDFLTECFDALNSDDDLPSVDQALLGELDSLLGKGAAAVPEQISEPTETVASHNQHIIEQFSQGGEDISDDEFEALLDNLNDGMAPGTVHEEVTSEDITDDEFEALLDNMYQGGAIPGDPLLDAPVESVVEPEPIIEAPKADTAPAEPPIKKERKKKENAESTIRVDTRKLDDIMNLAGELVLVRNRLKRLRAQTDEGGDALVETVSILDHVTTDLQTAVMKTRMQPVKKVFGRFPKLVRDLARSLKKEIELEMRGEDTELDKNLVEVLADPLIHLVRNSVDHGVEMPDEREKAGKARTGTIVLSASQESDHITLRIGDDGGGIDAEVIKNKALEKGVVDELMAEQMSDKEIYNLIFAPGFSTKQEISDISGRGVGMDVVKTQITKLNGSVEVDSVLGQGTEIVIRIPLTLAILPTLMVTVRHQNFAIPLSNVLEIFDFDGNQTNKIDNTNTIRLRGRSLPLYFLNEVLTNEWEYETPVKQKVVIVEIASVQVALIVDQVNGQEEVVIKPLGAMLGNVPGYAGATITGDGRIALILDVSSFVEQLR